LCFGGTCGDDRFHEIAVVLAAWLGHGIADSIHVQVAVEEGEEVADGSEPVVVKVGDDRIGILE
jgi:hypothetical protein